MQFKIKNIKIKISFTFFALILLLIIFQKTEYLIISLTSAIFHEAGHLLALMYFKTEILEFKISIFGANIKTTVRNQINYFKDIFISFSGPLVNLIISVFSYIFYNICFKKVFFDIYIVNLVLALFNLLPFYGFDGGKILQIILKQKFSDSAAEKAVTLISILILIPFIWFSFKVFLINKNDFYCLAVTILMLLTILLKS